MALEEPKTQVVAVMAEEVFLELESSAALSDVVTVGFILYRETDGEWKPEDTWDEDLPAEEVPLSPDAPPGKGHRTRIKWKVNFSGSTEVLAEPVRIRFVIQAKDPFAKPIEAKSLNELIVPGFSVTHEPKLHRIMLHEFSMQDDDGFYVFDPSSCQSVIDDLSVEQRKLLATHDLGSKSDRLVVFVTLRAMDDLFMCADNCQKPALNQAVKPNASFTVFHCKGPGKSVALIMHTNYFVVNMINPQTRALFGGSQDGKAYDAWLSRKNPKPPRFVSASFVMKGVTDEVVWSRIFTAKGADVMPGNTVHGMLNTVGCWMLFRNYNWPRGRHKQFTRIYIKHARNGEKSGGLAALAAEGYDVKPGAEAEGWSHSRDKFIFYDRNFAYNWFFRDVVGIEYFSPRFYQGATANAFNTHGRVFMSTFPKDQLLGGYQFHSIEGRRSKAKDGGGEPEFVATDSLWTTNALGFKTSEGWIPDALWRPAKNLKPDQVDKLSWADWFFYKEDGLSKAAALAYPLVPA